MGKITKREIAPDPKHDSVRVAKFINQVMRQGKKTIAQKIVYTGFDIIEKQTKGNPIEIFERALVNVAPKMEVRSKRVGGATYQVPYRVSDERGLTLAMRWIIQAAKNRSGASMDKQLANELIQAGENKGTAVKKRVDIHRVAQANKAFAYFARQGR